MTRARAIGLFGLLTAALLPAAAATQRLDEEPEAAKRSSVTNPVDSQTKAELPKLVGSETPLPSGKDEVLTKSEATEGTGFPVAIGTLPSGKSITVFFEATVDNPFPNSVTQVAQQATVTGANFIGFVTDDPDTPDPDDPTATEIVAAPNLVGATKTVSDAVTGNNDSLAQPGETLQYEVTVINSGSGGDVNVRVLDTVPVGSTLQIGSINVILAGGAAGPPVDASAGNTLDVTIPSMPGAGSSAIVQFQVVVDSPVPAGVEVLSNLAEVSSIKTAPFNTTQADITVEAIPVFTLTKDDGGGSFDPLTTISYVLDFENTGLQDASNVVIEETVPVGTTFDAGASSAGWSCSDGDPEGTPCTLALGTLGGGAVAAEIFAVEIVAPQFAPDLISNTATLRDDGAGSGGVPVEATGSDTSPVNDLLPPTIDNIDSVKGSGEGTLEECESVATKVSGFRVQFSEAMDAATVTDTANWQLVGAGPDLDLSTDSCGAVVGDDVEVPMDSVNYNVAGMSARVILDVPTFIDDGPYRLLACSGAGGMTDVVGNELDGDADFAAGDDYVRYFRVDRLDAFANGHFDCDLTDWVPMAEGGSSVTHEPLVDMDNAAISGSAFFENEPGNVDLAVGQCRDLGPGAVHEFSGFTFLDTAGQSIEVVRSCEYFASSDCSGAGLPTQVFFDTLAVSGVWTPFADVITVPSGGDSALCQVTLRSLAAAGYDAYLDDLSLDVLVPSSIFEDGFESGDTSAWDQTVP